MDSSERLAELDGVRTFFDKFGPRLPKAFWDQYEGLKERLKGKVAA